MFDVVSISPVPALFCVPGPVTLYGCRIARHRECLGPNDRSRELGVDFWHDKREDVPRLVEQNKAKDTP
jgi:hypothetical protein